MCIIWNLHSLDFIFCDLIYLIHLNKDRTKTTGWSPCWNNQGNILEREKDKYFLQCNLINTLYSTWFTYHIQHIHIFDSVINSNCICNCHINYEWPDMLYCIQNKHSHRCYLSPREGTQTCYLQQHNQWFTWQHFDL